MSTTLEHDEDAGQYALRVDGAVVSVLGYQRSGGTVVVLHTGTEPEHRGRGYASQLVDAALAELAREGRHVVLRCPFAKARQAAGG